MSEASAVSTGTREAQSITSVKVKLLSACVAPASAVQPGLGPDVEPPSALVWSLLYSRVFGPASCGPYVTPPARPTCPPAQPELLVLVDYATGRWIDMGTPPSETLSPTRAR